MAGAATVRVPPPDPGAERQFQELLTLRNARLEKQFHYARAVTWCLVLLRMLAARQWRTAVLLATGCLSTFLPALSDRLPQRAYQRWRLPLIVLDNLVQVAMGCYAHQTIGPASQVEAPSTFQMAAALVTGSGVAWLLFCPIWGSLPFRIAFRSRRLLPSP
ncbi:CMP-sialic acid transporter 4 [Micractinium conductrix]|uniref:CMP-sialic acid transporter 4 n=1 Tax=Micractinium conductrix TaxID=554055 RepID=A0A2P6VS04_9CHLO|nr:CMP-sialic acid transporter 4 [Micractinium conductrix]|eukprot:PSC76878.1 CMP-sialic acid transporter 4 [Micractinium conductrix]